MRPCPDTSGYDGSATASGNDRYKSAEQIKKYFITDIKNHGFENVYCTFKTVILCF